MEKEISIKIQSKINKLRVSYGNDKLDVKQKQFLRKFLHFEKRNVFLFLFFSFLETFLTIFFAILFNSYFEKYLEFLPLEKSYVIVLIVFLIIAFYLIVNYVVLRLAQTITYDLYNRVRRAWYKKGLDKEEFSKPVSGGNLFSKIIYHSQLLKMGVEKVLIDGVKSVFLYVSLLIVSFFFNSTLFSFFLFSFPLLLIVFASCWYLGRYFISREQTINVKIIRHMFTTLMNRKNIQSLNLEQRWAKTMNGLLELDTYFRQRREVWFKMSDRFIWAFFIFFGVSVYFLQSVLPVTFFYGWVDMAVTGLLLAFFTKTVYHVANLGLFFHPLILGLKIAVPTFSVTFSKSIKYIPKNFSVIFKSDKTKLSRFGKYIKKFRLEIESGKTVLVSGKGPVGKTTLGLVIAGQKIIKSMNVKIGKKLMTCFKWPGYEVKRMFVSNSKPNSFSFLQYLSGNLEIDVTGEQIHQITEELGQYDFLKPLLEHPNFLARKVFMETISDYEWLLLNIAHVMLNPYNIVVFDHSVVDVDKESFCKAFNELTKTKQNCAFVIFSGGDINNLGDVSKFVLTENSLGKVL